MPIVEIAEFNLKQGTADRFEAVVVEWMPVFRAQPGCRSFEIHRSIELPDRVRLIIEWDTVEAHTVDFSESDDHARFVEAIEPFFAIECHVEHTNVTYRESPIQR